MINYYKIWESINEESKSNNANKQIARKVPYKSIYPVFLATDFKKGIRLLYIKLDSDCEIKIDNLPCFKGLEISIIKTSVAEYKDQIFLKFTQTIPNIDNIFELVISDICDRIIQLKNKSHLAGIIIKVLNEWKIFFEKEENELLPISSQKGLVGELYFLKDYLFHKYSFSDSIKYWTGAEKTNHDFQINDIAVEVKTTSSKQHKKFIISSEKQLDNTGISNLYLSLVTLNIHNNMISRSLPVLVNDICSIIQEDPIAYFQFEIKLTKYGFNIRNTEKYTTGFSLTDVRFFEVKDDFPRLLQSNLPEGIGDVKYSIVVSACSPFEIKSDILKLL